MEFEEVPGFQFAFTDGGDTPKFDMEALRAALEKIRQMALDRLNREIGEAFEAERRRVRTCFAGHLHGTLEGRVFCDTMRGHL